MTGVKSASIRPLYITHAVTGAQEHYHVMKGVRSFYMTT